MKHINLLTKIKNETLSETRGDDASYFVGFLLIFILLCIGIFYMPYEIGLIIDNPLQQVCDGSILGIVLCWFQGISVFNGILVLVLSFIIIWSLIVLTSKIMDLIWK